jgi:hypothetical protein
MQYLALLLILVVPFGGKENQYEYTNYRLGYWLVLWLLLAENYNRLRYEYTLGCGGPLYYSRTSCDKETWQVSLEEAYRSD